MLGYSPPWLVTRLREIGERHDAFIAITGEAEPELFANLDGARVWQGAMRTCRRRRWR